MIDTNIAKLLDVANILAKRLDANGLNQTANHLLKSARILSESPRESQEWLDCLEDICGSRKYGSYLDFTPEEEELLEEIGGLAISIRQQLK